MNSKFFKYEEAKLARLPTIAHIAGGGTFFDHNLALLKSNPDFKTLGTSLVPQIFAGSAIGLTGLFFLGQFKIEPEVNVT